jgi:hypothetical protein
MGANVIAEYGSSGALIAEQDQADGVTLKTLPQQIYQPDGAGVDGEHHKALLWLTCATTQLLWCADAPSGLITVNGRLEGG